ncbi:hypothetical protein BH23VER1_BH23VER1_04500 [soil metagenome]
MKPSSILSAVLPLAIAAVLPPAASGTGNVALRLEYYELDHVMLNTLVAEPTDSMDAGTVREAVLELVRTGEATQIESAFMVTKSGQRAKVESVIEWIYPIEYDPPEIAKNIKGPISAGTDIMSLLTPTAFDTRNLGLTFEADPVVDPGGELIDLNLSPELDVNLGDNTYGQDESTVNHPVIHSLEARLVATLYRGHWAILSIHSPPPVAVDAVPVPDRRVLTLLHADFFGVGVAGDEVGEDAERPSDPFGEQPDEPDAPAAGVGLFAEWFELGAVDATRLLDVNPGAGADATKLRETLSAWIAEGRASLFESAYLVTKSGQRAKSESAQGWIFPIEVTVGSSPQSIVGPIDPDTRLTSRVSYSAYDTRKLGTILEADPVIGPSGRMVDLIVAAGIAEFSRNVTIGQGKSSVEMPIFYSMKAQTSITARTGIPIVLSQHSPRPDDVTKPHFGSEKRILCIVTARVLTAE